MANPRAGKPSSAAPVKFIAALLLGKGFDKETRLITKLGSLLGKVDYTGAAYPFDKTDYYEGEMGRDLSRMIISFHPLGQPTDIVRIKIATTEIEKDFKENGCRRVNIDPGYIDYFKVVLASFKEGPQKIYLGEGVYADPVLMYHGGAWKPPEWSFPDFKAGLYNDDFIEIRRIYREARRAG